MAIAPPGDIIADVMKAANPERVRAVVAKLGSFGPPELTRTGAGAAVGHFAKGYESLIKGYESISRSTRALSYAKSDRQGDLGAASRKLEVLLLKQAFETMLPERVSGASKSGAGAGFWRSVLAETLAESVSGKVSLGIAPVIGGVVTSTQLG